MSWQLGAFAILGLALAAGFAWYERGHPDSRVVALVATLAALAGLGRVAFAALPNVKPTTDVVLIAGYALGGAPGFAVGAVAGLTSNFFFGQGPWTPWQMAAWGATGIFGALLARATAGRIGRWRLALVCFGVGYAFAAFQDLGDWVNFSDHSWAQLWVYLGRGTAFDLIHAAGCLAFALAFGPALARSLRRFTTRLQITWLPGPALVLAFAVALALSAGAPAPAQAGGSPSGYLLAAQNADGGFGAAPGTPSDPLTSGWVALGLESAGQNPADVRRGGSSLLAYVDGQGAGDPGALERTILVQAAAGASPAADLARLRAQIRGDGSVSGQVNLTAFAVLALRAAGAGVPGHTTAWVAAQQNRDGGFGFSTRGGASDCDDTGAVLEALGGRQPVAGRAVRFLRRQQNPDGGFPAQPGQESNAQSTAWVVQGLLAAGVDPDSLRAGAHSPLDYLQGLVGPDGHVRYSRSNDQTPVWVTGEALMALQRRPLPLAAVPRQAAPGPAASASGHRRAGVAPTVHAHHRRRAALRRSPRGARLTRVLDRLASGAGAVAALVYAPAGI